MRQFDIFGMSCAACSARVEKAVSNLEGVTECSVNLLTNSMTIKGTATDNDIIKAVQNAGYDAVKHSDEQNNNGIHDGEITTLRKRLISSLIFLAILMYVSMGHVMWNFPLPYFLAQSPIVLGILQLILTVIVMIINRKFFTSGFKALVRRAPNMDSLVALGSGAAFIYSVCVLFSVVLPNANHHVLHELYFESAAMILALITVGKMLEAYSKGKTTNALKKLLNLAPKTAIIEVNNEEREISIKDIMPGDIFIVKTGASFPADGVVLSGHCAVDESAITGESIPTDKSEGDYVTSATINKSGYVRCRAEKVGNDTTLSQIIKLVTDASATKAPIAKAADKVSGVFVPVVITIAILTFLVWLILDYDIGFSLARGISVLVISCPCALGLATPVAIMVASGVGAKSGILFKNATALEEAGKVSVVALDKTGTITKGKPHLTDITSKDDELLPLAYSLELKSEHPLALAVTEYAKEKSIVSYDSTDFKVYAGNGLEAIIDGHRVVGGNFDFVSKFCTVPEDMTMGFDKLTQEGKTPLFFAKDNSFLGIIAVADEIKEDSRAAICQLKNMGIKVVMLTGDNQRTANAIASYVGIDEVYATITPQGKEEIIQKLKTCDTVAMVGDGINDAPALTSSNVAIAIGAGADIAVDAADIVLTKSSILDVATAIRLGRMTLKNIYENLFWAFIYNTIGIPVAAGVLIPIFGISLDPMFAAAAMSLSSFCVVTNALRLNFKDIKNSKKDKMIKFKEKKYMEITLKIDGMMCPHCEARVKEALEKVDGVLEVIPSHVNKTALIKLTKDVDVAILKDTVTAQGYKVID